MDDYRAFYAMTDAELINTVAFHLTDYILSARHQLKRMLLDRGYNENTVKDWRQGHLLVTSFESPCERCRVELILEEEDLITGAFSCPDCGHLQDIRFEISMIRKRRFN